MTKRNKSRRRSLCAASGPLSEDPQLGPATNYISSVGAEARSLCAGASSDRIPDNNGDPVGDLAGCHSQGKGSGKGESSGIPSTAARAIIAEVEAEQTALHVAVVGLLAEAREREHLAVLVHWLLARVTA